VLPRRANTRLELGVRSVQGMLAKAENDAYESAPLN
jgi:hypothetical protein